MNSTVISNTTAAPTAASIVPSLQSLLKTFNFYMSILVLFPGLVLNICTFVIFLRPKFWKRTTMGYYYSVSAALSTAAVCVGILNFFPAVYNNDLQLKSDFMCKLIWLARCQVIYGSGYFQILITLDLTLNTLYYRRFTFLTKVKVLAAMTFVIEALVAVSNSVHWGRYLKYTPNGVNNGTVTYLTTCTMTSDLLITFSFEAILDRVIPSLSNLTMSFLIIRALIRSKRNMNRTISAKELHFAYSLIAQNVIFFIITLPHVILSGMQLVNTFVQPTSDYANVINVIYSFGSWGNYVFESIPFLMNLGFNKLFRAEVFSILGVRGSRVGFTATTNGECQRTNTKATKPGMAQGPPRKSDIDDE
jgi:hypothetical protein